jgi:hypothetical protein
VTRQLPEVMASVMAVLLSSSLFEPSQYRLRYFSLPPRHTSPRRVLSHQIFDWVSPRGLCCPLLCRRHMPLIGCPRSFIGIGVPFHWLTLEPDRRRIRPFFLKLQRLSKTYAIGGQCPRTLFFRLVRSRCRCPAPHPVVAPVVTDFVNLSRPAARQSTARLRTDVLWVQPAAASSGYSPAAALNNPLQDVARCALCAAQGASPPRGQPGCAALHRGAAGTVPRRRPRRSAAALARVCQADQGFT